MKHLKYLIAIVTALVALLAASCNDDYPSQTGFSVKMLAVRSNGSASAGRVQAATVEFNEAFIGVTELEFELLSDEDDDDDDDDGEEHDNSGPGTHDDDGEGHDEDDDDCDKDDDGDDDDDDGEHNESDSLEFEGEFIVDLINGTSTPDFGVAKVVPGTYKEVEVKLAPILPEGKSVFISMTVSPDSVSDPLMVEFSLERSFEVEIKDHDGFTLEGGDLKQFLVLLDLDALFGGIDFSDAVVDDDGIIRINEKSNLMLAAQIKRKLSAAIRGGEDSDRDNDIDD